MSKEVQFVLQTYNISPLPDANEHITADTDVVLVDASDLQGMSSTINPSQVIEIIDHRKVHQADQFPNAHVQIELVGSAATLVAERFVAQNIPISPESAILLYSAIISNTINFQASVTTQRDCDMSAWLLQHCAP